MAWRQDCCIFQRSSHHSTMLIMERLAHPKETHLNSHMVCFPEVFSEYILSITLQIPNHTTKPQKVNVHSTVLKSWGLGSQQGARCNLQMGVSNIHKNPTFYPQLRAPPFATEFATTRGCLAGSSVAPSHHCMWCDTVDGPGMLGLSTANVKMLLAKILTACASYLAILKKLSR